MLCRNLNGHSGGIGRRGKARKGLMISSQRTQLSRANTPRQMMVLVAMTAWRRPVDVIHRLLIGLRDFIAHTIKS